MTLADRWLLPDGIEEVLPPRAQQIEHLRRHLLDQMDNWGYQLVIPPALEYLEALLTGTGKDLDLRTFKVTDQISGRMLGLSADTTSQVARIDAHSMKPEGIGRFCYCRTVFHTRARSLLASRTPTQIGAELFGTGGVAADVELISLMISTLEASQLQDIHLDMGNVAIYKILVEAAGLTDAQQLELSDLMSLKCLSDIEQWTADKVADETLRKAFNLLIRLQGSAAQIQSVSDQLNALVPACEPELKHLMDVANAVTQRYSSLPINFDLTELRGYAYHTGLVFAAYVPGYGDAVAAGGRYDETGAEFGREGRPARGFSADLKVLAQLGSFAPATKTTVLAPLSDEDSAGLWQAINDLRASGKRVVQGEDDSSEAEFRLERTNSQWQLVKNEQNQAS
ncbi:MAG: ATP phosphoribosyltransferase regulatory subunit [Oceanobacter sp.]